MKRGLPKEASIKGMLFTAFSGTLVGLLLACVILLTEMPKNSQGTASLSSVARLGIYQAEYSVGSVASEESATTRSRMSRLSRKMPGSIPFTESELNYYLRQYRSGDTNEDGTPANVSFSSPNVRLEEKAFVISSKIVVNPKSDRFEILAQVFCHLENGANGIELKIDRLVLNSLVVPQLGGIVGDMLLSKLAAIPLPADLVDSWKAIREIELLEGKLVLVL